MLSAASMRFLLAGLALIALGVAGAEYSRRRAEPGPQLPSSADSAAPLPPSGQTVSAAAAKALLESAPPPIDFSTSLAAAQALLEASRPSQPSLDGLVPLLSGRFRSKLLTAGFGYAVLAVDVADGSCLIRLEPGEAPVVLAALSRPISALTLDGSTLFFAAGQSIFSLPARGGASPQVIRTFASATVTSLAATGDTLVAALMPRKAMAEANESEGAVVRFDSTSEPKVLTERAVRPQHLVTDGTDVYFVADGLWRAGLDGTFSSRIASDIVGPLAADGASLVAAGHAQILRLPRAGGRATTIASAKTSALVASSGLIRYLSGTGPTELYEVTAGAEPRAVATVPGAPVALALGGTTVFILAQESNGQSTVFAK